MKIRSVLITSFFVISCVYAVYAGEPPSDKARGLFFTIGVGPRLPMGNFSKTSGMGYGINFEMDYTDNEYLPIFLFGKVGVEHFPGNNDYYATTDYSNYSINFFPFAFGGRVYLPPLVQSYFLVLPHVEASVQFAFFSNLNQFKIDSGLPTYTEDGSKFGLSVGAGFSMFFMEITGYYNYYQNSQSLSMDLKVRLPLFASI